MNSIQNENITIAIVYSGTTVKKNRMSFRYEKCAIVAKLGTDAASRIQDTKSQSVLFEYRAYPYASHGGLGGTTKADAEKTMQELEVCLRAKTWKGVMAAAHRSENITPGYIKKLAALAPAAKKGSL